MCGVPPLFPALVAFALGRGEQRWLPGPSWDSREGVRAAWVLAVVGGCRLLWAGQWAGVSVARGGPRSCSLPSLVGVCGVCWGPGATGRNRFGRPGEALSRSAGVELGTADAGVPPAHPAPRS